MCVFAVFIVPAPMLKSSMVHGFACVHACIFSPSIYFGRSENECVCVVARHFELIINWDPNCADVSIFVIHLFGFFAFKFNCQTRTIF